MKRKKEMKMAKDFYTAVEERRSIYVISKDHAVSNERIQEVVEFAVKHTPTSFNSQSGRVVVLFNQHHDKFWDLTKETLREIVPAEDFGPTEQKMEMFKAGSGTVLFFEDEEAVRALQEQFPTYSDKFPEYSLQSSGMLQFIVWTALEQEGLGATLQHYQPLIDEKVRNEWNIPASWKLHAQMPFGQPVAPAGDKEFQPLSERMKVFK
ncbi:Nitroreductase family protein [Bacillus badius]|uniref:Nitroreductase family protein n=2 Tax=Bacillus badius TaxID=1455 RepID=A0ABR5AX60_BACBA|nr:Nitroreductase family protein [Bacillus badius]KIL79339.1 Nitroreductase family protein [Bacillus badius]